MTESQARSGSDPSRGSVSQDGVYFIKPVLSICNGTRCNNSEHMSDYALYSTVTEKTVFPDAIKRVTEYDPLAFFLGVARIEYDRDFRLEQSLGNVTEIGGLFECICGSLCENTVHPALHHGRRRAPAIR